MAGLYTYSNSSDTGIYLYMGKLSWTPPPTFPWLILPLIHRLHAALLDAHSDIGTVLCPPAALQGLGEHCQRAHQPGSGGSGWLPGASPEPGPVLVLVAIRFARTLAAARSGAG